MVIRYLVTHALKYFSKKGIILTASGMTVNKYTRISLLMKVESYFFIKSRIFPAKTQCRNWLKFSNSFEFIDTNHGIATVAFWILAKHLNKTISPYRWPAG